VNRSISANASDFMVVEQCNKPQGLPPAQKPEESSWRESATIGAG